MREWRRCTIGGLIEEGVILVHKDGNHGANYPRLEDFGNEGFPFLTAKSLSDGRIDIEGAPRLSGAKAKTLRFGFVKEGDVLLSHNATVGRVAIVPKNEHTLVIGTSLTQFRPKPDVLMPEFLALYFMGRDFQNYLSFVMAQTTRNQVPITEQRRLPLHIPPIQEQRAIVGVVFSLINKIELNRRMNETLEAMARAIFQDWFVTFGPTRAKMEGRPPYLAPDLWSLFPDRLDAEGKPEGWKSGTLNDFVSILETGGRPKGGVSAYREGVPSIGAESIVGLGIFDYNKTKFIPRPYFEKMTKGHIQSRDVLLYKDGGRPGEFEPHATLFGDGFPFEECAINEHVYRIRATPDFGQNLLYFSLTSEATMAEMRLKGTGVAIPGLNSTQARSLTLLLPSRTAAEGFERTTEPFIGRVLANCKEAKTLAATRDLLLPRLMSGELRVKDAERVVETAA